MDPKQTPGRDSKGEPKPEAKVDVKGDGAEAKPSAKAEAKPRPKIVFKNPAFRAMGLKQITLPLRNWIIFWTVVGLIGGAIYYDNRERKAVRQRLCDQLAPLGERTYHANELPRKLTIYIAPPPDDYLDESVKLFRKYIKPFFNAAALDFEIFSERRQGDIRATVAQKIRELRQKQVDDRVKAELERQQKQKEALWSATIAREWGKVKGVFSKRNIEEEEERTTPLRDLYNTLDVLGLYKVMEPIKVVKEDSLDTVHAGGVVCIGRGAYKEYLHGVHEGLLGPLTKPDWLVEQEEQERRERMVKKLKDQAKDKGEDPELITLDLIDPTQPFEEEAPVTKPFIKTEDYANAPLAPELNMTQMVLNDDGVPVVFEQPVYVIPVPNLSGFRNFPRMIYRWFHKRDLAEAMAERALVVINDAPRPFEFKDTMAAGEEELDWPKKWVERGKERGSEWVQELITDDRVTGRMRTYEGTTKEL